MTIDDLIRVHPIVPIQPVPPRNQSSYQNLSQKEEPPMTFEEILEREMKKSDH